MKILAIQGSPRPKTSNTEILLKEFLKGAQSQGAETETVYLKGKNINSCTGCFSCWIKTPGVCIFKDDMPELLEKIKECDIIVYATPLYNYNMTSLLKAFQERLLPLADPHIIKAGDISRHPQRYEKNRKMVLISNCGFPEVSHFDALRQVFYHMEKSSQVPLVGEILMPEGELLKLEFFQEKLQPVLQAVYRAGVEVIRDGKISKETEVEIQKPVIPPDDMIEMANFYWDSELAKLTKNEQSTAEGKGIQDIRLILRGMAVSFNSQTAGDLKATVQFEVSGKQPGKWYLLIDEGTCSFHEGTVDSPTLTIKTPSEVWLAIANSELDGQKAFMKGKYTVTGDIGLLIRFNSLFDGVRS